MRELKFRYLDWVFDYEKDELVRKYVYVDIYKQPDGGFCLDEGEEYEQYTGLKDKNGKEIYEGDIIWGYQVIWVNRCGGFKMDVKGARLFDIAEIFDGARYNPVVVMGNVHENKELLK